MQSSFWAGSKKIGPAQNILGPVKGKALGACENKITKCLQKDF
jgi:hypothetical protein